MDKLEKIHNWLKSADSMIITAGAGIGVDSGLKDYRGNSGQWGKVENDIKLNAVEVVNPKYLAENPKYVWSMFVKRMFDYEKTIPHNGFNILLKWIKKFNLDYFVLTSNVDEQFIKAGFDKEKYRELHGSIFYMQCIKPCTQKVWRHTFNIETLIKDIEDEKYPLCPHCKELLRPNVYMFRDTSYIFQRSNEQEKRFQEFLSDNKNKKIIVFEIGSGPHVQSIRKKTRMLGLNYNANIIRINLKNAKIKEPHIGIDKGALDTLKEIDFIIEN